MNHVQEDFARLSDPKSFPLFDELSLLGFGAQPQVKSWIKSNQPHPVVAGFVRKGASFARAPYKAARDSGVKGFSISKELEQSTVTLWRLLCTSHDFKKDFYESTFEDVFVQGAASKAINMVFMRKGWSSRVWDAQFVEHSSFRAAIGMAVMLYGLYLHQAIANGDIATAITQTADAGKLLHIDLEKKSSIRYKRSAEALSNAPRHLGKKGGDAANAAYKAAKARVFEWLGSNLQNYKGRLDEAADEIERLKLVSLDWRTIRAYITAYRKIQSSGTK